MYYYTLFKIYIAIWKITFVNMSDLSSLFEIGSKTTVDQVEKLISNGGADVNKKLNSLWYALMNAIDNRARFDVIEFLIKNGANLQICNSYGNTPLMHTLSRHIINYNDYRRCFRKIDLKNCCYTLLPMLPMLPM